MLHVIARYIQCVYHRTAISKTFGGDGAGRLDPSFLVVKAG